MIGERLKQLRKERGIKQEDLAKIIGVTKSSVSMYETNKTTPSYSALAEIVRHFNVSADYLIGVVDEEVPPCSKDVFIRLPSCLSEFDCKLLLEFLELMIYRANKATKASKTQL